MNVAKKTKARFRVGDVVSFLYGPQRVRGTVIEDRGPLGTHGRRIFLVQTSLGEDEAAAFEVPEDNLDDPAQVIEDESPGPRVEFSVTYARQGSTKRWRASVKRGRRYEGVKAKGAVAYSTASWAGENEDDQRRAVVTVFLVPDLEEEETETLKARAFADRMFMSRNPNALIEE